jgi:hypothetical protein
MEISVWQLFAKAVTLALSQLGSSSEVPNPPSGGESVSAPESDAASTSTSKNATILAVVRDHQTSDGIFGTILVDGGKVCFSMERTAVAIPAGTYHCDKETSPHFGFETPHLAVPGRTYIEIHPANYPAQLEGCIAVGTTIDNDSLDNSRAAFDKLMALLPQEFSVTVTDI